MGHVLALIAIDPFRNISTDCDKPGFECPLVCFGANTIFCGQNVQSLFCVIKTVKCFENSLKNHKS